jgi:hypothetical protein
MVYTRFVAADNAAALFERIRIPPGKAPCEIRQGSLRDAILFACGANAVHGLRRTNKDKRRAVRTLLKDPEWSQWTDVEIARRCAVDPKTVAAHRPKDIIGNSDD